METFTLTWILLNMNNGGGLVAKSCPTLVILWTVACQVPLSMGFPRQEHWCGLPFPSLGDLPNPGIKPWSPTLQADVLTSEPPMTQMFYEGDQHYSSRNFMFTLCQHHFQHCVKIVMTIS